jgi:ComF family protein
MNARRAAAAVGRAAQSLISVLLPPLCVGCDNRLGPQEESLCGSCRIALASGAWCRRRTLAIGDGKDLEVRYGLHYTSRLSKIVTRMKYGDMPGLARLLVPFMALGVRDIDPGCVVVPVPMHASKKRERGFNQSEIMGRALADLKGLRFEAGILVKSENTASQVSLEKERRLDNVEGTFRLRTGNRPVPESILIVDDVVTTGSTLRECARAILAGGVQEVSACVVASSS